MALNYAIDFSELRGLARGDLGLALFHLYSSELQDGVKEQTPNTGPRIRQYARRFSLDCPLNWCAVMCSTLVQDAAEALGIRSPIEGSAAAQGVMAQLMRAGLWIGAARVLTEEKAAYKALRSGNIVVWRRPPHTWTGHIGIVTQRGVGTSIRHFLAIEGNSGAPVPAEPQAWRRPGGDRVAERKRALTDPLLLGFGNLRAEDDDAPDTLTAYELWLAREHLALSCEPVCEHDPLDPPLCP